LEKLNLVESAPQMPHADRSRARLGETLRRERDPASGLETHRENGH
jgi:hypothetical protein